MKTSLPLDSSERKKIPLWSGLFQYARDALIGAARISFYGNTKHNPGQPLHHARWKSMDHADCILRHLADTEIDYGYGIGMEPIFDDDGNLLELIPFEDQLVWRALMYAQEYKERHRNVGPAPRAKLHPDHEPPAFRNFVPLPAYATAVAPEKCGEVCDRVKGHAGTHCPAPPLAGPAGADWREHR